MSYILNIGVATPDYQYSQRELAIPLQSLYSEGSMARRKIPAILSRSSIDFRYSVLGDFKPGNGASFYNFNENMVCLPDVGQRMAEFRIKSIPLAKKAVANLFTDKSPKQLSEVTHVVVASCTGMSAPGLEILLPESLGMSQHIQRYAVNFMGCYAAFHALKLADMICKTSPDALVLVVCVELSTLHMRRAESDDNLLSSGLFADGAAAVLVSPENLGQKQVAQILGFNSALIRDGGEDMQWNIGPDGFQMALNARIPGYIATHMGDFYDNALKKAGIHKHAVQHFAIHPGGRKILEAFVESLGIDNAALDASFKILRNYGNMSSPTVLFVLKELWENHFTKNNDEYIFSAAFGPGLTIESAFLKMIFPNGKFE
jgi:predicted naringenin-chalcone synthase